jgi:hypothetical protein
MPRLSVLFIRAALTYLAVGFTFGGLMLFHKGIALHPALWRLLPAHIEFVLFGWTVQLAMGVGFWILPRFSRGPERGDERPAWAAFVLLNAGVLLVGLGSLWDASGWLFVIGRVAEVAAAMAFTVHAWPRVKPLLTRAG